MKLPPHEPMRSHANDEIKQPKPGERAGDRKEEEAGEVVTLEQRLSALENALEQVRAGLEAIPAPPPAEEKEQDQTDAETRLNTLTSAFNESLEDIAVRLMRLELEKDDEEELLPDPVVGEVTEDITQEIDERLAVDHAATPDHLGATYNDGVLRVIQTDGADGLLWGDGGNHCNISHYDTSAISADTGTLAGDTVFSRFTFDTMGHVLTTATRELPYLTEAEVQTLIEAYLPTPNAVNDMLISRNGTTWSIIAGPDTDYKLLQRLSDDTVDWNWPLGNAATP